ncbi:MAG: choice-of-anchor Q domain-containing protein [Thermodesulfobacteriota bacterium]
MKIRMMTALAVTTVLVLAGGWVRTVRADQLGVDYPHYAQETIGCDSCHYIVEDQHPAWVDHEPQNIDDTPFNNLCWSCHNDVRAPYVVPHSSRTTNSQRGTWSIECRTCHWPHHQMQMRTYGAASYVATGTSTGLTATTLTMDGAGWEPDALVGYILMPNTSQISYNYRITGNSAETLTVDPAMELGKASAGNTFAIFYGKLVKSSLPTPNSGTKTVKFFRKEGANSYADGNAVYDGVCEVCHTLPRHFRNDGSAPDQLHTNVRGGQAGAYCIPCHSHDNGFAHGSGVGGGTCPDCHGHDLGYGGATGGAGTFASHSTHTENDTDDAKGPNIGCDGCHDTNAFPNFKDSATTLAATTVCNPCHSPGGDYDGVDDPILGAKANWDAGVYLATNNSTLRSGKEKWCATCHDKEPSEIYGVSAPNVVGDEDGSYTYGTGWGYYKTGHGLVAGENYPSKGGIQTLAGRPVHCDSCHDYASDHNIDADPRTFDDGESATTDPSVYREGFRLKLVGMGQGTGTSTREPMLVPRPPNSGNLINQSRLCYNCHDSGPFLSSSNMSTNLVTAGVNRHEYHMVINNYQYPADWSGGNTSLMTCPNCHNVHGSTRLAMVRDGKLTGREPGLEIWYKNAITTILGAPVPPDPADVPLAASDGTAWINHSVTNICVGCHGNNNLEGKDRNPYQSTDQAPFLSWTGETGYTADGASPDSGPSSSTFTFRVEYTDFNNEPPSFVEVWVDANDNGSYEAGEKHAMTGVDAGDVNVMNGKIYTKSLTLTSAGDNIIRYRFTASDGSNSATGAPTGDGSVTILNNGPTLAWTGEASFTDDGVSPNTGGNGASFTFRVSYTDADNQAPASIQVWIDANDNGSYEAGEKHDLTAMDGGDTNYADGKLYATTRAVAFAGDGTLGYRFYASDGSSAATGLPAADSTFSVVAGANSPPLLEWVAATCRAEGVKPAAGATGADFEFFVRYTDPENQCPPAASDIQVWVDVNDNSAYEPGEKYNLSADDPGDANCADGKLYKKTMSLALAGDNVLAYRFAASDGTDPAIGTPVTGSTLTVVNAQKVRPGGGVGWYATIQGAIDAVDGAHTVLVYDGTYNENLSFSGVNDADTTVRSVCGPEVTTISNPGTVVLFLSNSGNLLDGFTVTGGTIGVYFNSATATVNNCKIHSNNNPGANGGGIYTANIAAVATITNSEIYNNTAGNGAGAFFNAATGHSFTNCTIRNNTASGGGGAVFSQNGSADFIDVVLKDNTATGAGGAVYANGSGASFVRCTITGNTASGTSGVVYPSNAGTSILFESCLVANNRGTQGGVSYVNTGSLTAVNSTFAGNQATAGSGGVIYNQGASSVFRNCILWDNSATSGGHVVHFNAGSVTIQDALLASGHDGIFTNRPYLDHTGAAYTLTVEGYLSDSDPLFVDAAAGDFHLQSVSAAVDHGNAAYAPATDLDGDARPQGAADDLGADEYRSAVSAPSLAWTGEAGYTADGVSPDSGGSGTGFVFRVDYTDADNDPPVAMEVWVDADDNGTYGPSEKHAMTAADAGDTTYSDGKRYTLTLAVSMAGDGSIPYRFSAQDGTFEATGAPVAGGSLTVTNNPPTLAWTGEANYVADGVHPDSAIGGTSFAFRVDYTDADNTAPAFIEVWVDADDNNTYGAGEKHALTATDGGDATYSDGKRYAAAVPVLFAGDGSLKYRFFASDGSDDATGLPTADQTLTVTNNAPTLAWTGEAGYASDGVNPDSGPDASSFQFRVDYTDTDNTLPALIQVWVDANDNSTYEPGEKMALTATDAGDTTVTDGKRYAATQPLAYTGDGVYTYRFFANDGTADATGPPTANSTVTVTFTPNNAPTLAWTGEAGYTADGVAPDSGPGGNTFVFRVSYSDTDNDAPSAVQVWIDANDNLAYEAGEKHDMTAVDAGDTTYTDGKLFTASRAVAYNGDGTLKYRFYAQDTEAAEATGTPADPGGTLTVVNPITVCASGCDYTSIQGAISSGSTPSGAYILVKNGTYSENVNFGGKNVYVYSENGAANTTIQGAAGNNPVLTFSNGETASAVVDGFTIDNQFSGAEKDRGIFISNNAAPTIKNCIVKGHTPANNYNGGAGIHIDGGGATIDSCTIGDAVAPNSSRYGSGVYAANAGGALTITNSSLVSNQTIFMGGAIYLNNRSSTTTITGTTVSNNTAGQHAGGIYCANSPLVINSSTIEYNSTPTNYEGGGLYLTGAATTLTITGPTSISHNSSRHGPGIYANGIGTVSVSDTTLNANTSSTGMGGGMHLTAMTSSITVTNTAITNNSTSAQGAGIYLSAGTSLTFSLTNCTIDTNTVTNTAGSDGGGLYLAASNVAGLTLTANITGGTISNNSARNSGGIHTAVSGTNSPALVLNITGTTIQENEAINGYGGGLTVAGNATASVSKAWLRANKAKTYGGGIYNTATATVTNSMITGNLIEGVSYNDGGGVYTSGTMSLYSSTVAGNRAARNGGGWQGGGTIRNSIFWGNTAGGTNHQINGSPTTTYTDIAGGCTACVDKTGNIDLDPVFVDLQFATAGNPNAGGNFHICRGVDDPVAGCLGASGAIDVAGTANAPADDYDGQGRPYDVAGLGDGTDDYDMGADEYRP